MQLSPITDPVLWQAVSSSNLQIVRVVVEAGASLDVREANWGIPMFNQAASTGELDIVEYLIKKGAKTNATDKYGGNALEEAAFNGCKKVAERLVRLGLKSKFPLHVAAGLGDVKAVRKALANEADPNQVTGWNNSALFFSVGGGSAETTKLLLAAEARTGIKNVFGCTALHYAAAMEDQRLAKMLIEAGADVNVSNKDGERPLDWAGDEGVVRLLKAAGAKHGDQP